MKTLFYAQQPLQIDGQNFAAGDLMATVETPDGIPTHRILSAIQERSVGTTPVEVSTSTEVSAEADATPPAIEASSNEGLATVTSEVPAVASEVVPGETPVPVVTAPVGEDSTAEPTAESDAVMDDVEATPSESSATVGRQRSKRKQ